MGLVLAVVVAVPGLARAGYKTVVGGVSVSYSKLDAEAFYDPDDDTLTIFVYESGGSLKVTARTDCNTFWGGAVDVFIQTLEDVVLSSISLKGRTDCAFFVGGFVGGASKLTASLSVIGLLDAYEPDFGLFTYQLIIPKSISIKNGVAAGPVLLYDPAAATARSAGGPPAGKVGSRTTTSGAAADAGAP
jgi:hypothetical protein